MGSNRDAAEASIGAWRTAGVFEETDEALIALALALAAAVDADPCVNCGSGQNAALWREYRAALGALREVATGGVDDDAASFLAEVRIPRRGVRSEVGDS